MAKKVRCADCGYLIEIDTDSQGLKFEGVIIKLKCFRGRKLYSSENVSMNQTLINSEKTLPKVCKYFKKKIPGLTPEQHLEQELNKEPERKFSKFALKISCVSAFISFVALIVSILVAIFK